MPKHQAPIVSVFSSLQGEGLFVGKPHLFIRLAGCNLRCSYCDTPEGLSIPKKYQIEKIPFSGNYKYADNPINSGLLLAAINEQVKLFPFYHSIVLTGGEPLLHTSFLKELLPQLAGLKIPIMLETNGTLPAQLEKMGKWIDIVSMDIKMPSDIKDNKIDIWEAAAAFIRLSQRGGRQSKLYVKIVITDSCPAKDYQTAVRVIAKANRDIPVILQPACVPSRRTSAGRPTPTIPSLKRLVGVYRLFAEELDNVRIIPRFTD